MECPLVHENKKEETDTEKLIYYCFRRFHDCSNKELFKWQQITFFRAYLVTILKTINGILAWPFSVLYPSYVFFLHVNRRSLFFSFRSPIRFYCLATYQAKHCWLWSKSIVSHCLSHFLWCSNVNTAATEGTWEGQNCVSLNNWKPQRQHRKSLW